MTPQRNRTRDWCWLLLLAIAISGGCRSRSGYRHWADREVGCLIESRQNDPLWQLPGRPVTAAPTSRMADLAPPDCAPLPPDDPAAHEYMHCAGCMRGYRCWHCRGDLASIEFLDWKDYLPDDEQGVVKLRRDMVMELALLHARDYQTEIERLYLNALSLTLERFEFSTRWFARNSTFFDAVGIGGPPASRRLRTTSGVGFERSLAAGGELLVEFANSFVWEFAGGTTSSASSGLLVSLAQPLLRGAFREVRMESLTQAERNLLYGVRDFARFRRDFYVNIVGGGGYLGLLGVAQGVKNEEKNLEALARNLEEHEQLGQAGMVSQIQIDQVFQQYQSGRLALMQANQALQRALDLYKIRLGLPPELYVVLDEEALKPFELNNPQLEMIQARDEALRLELLQGAEAPDTALIETAVTELSGLREELNEIFTEVWEDLEQWRSQLATEGGGEDEPPEPSLEPQAGEPEEEDFEQLEFEEEPLEDRELEPGTFEEGTFENETRARERELSEALTDALEEVLAEFEEDAPKLARLRAQLPTADEGELVGEELEAALETIDDLVGRRFRKQAADLFVIQAQVRVHLIEITPVEVETEAAVRIALQNRLDIMNARAAVVDAYRRVEVAADGLEGDLNLRMEAELGTDPGRINPIRFDASANRYRIGFDFDGPVTRVIERNVYRAAQIAFQQARRDFMETQDRVVADIRDDVRILDFERFSFETSRLQLLTAARQVDEAQLNLRSADQASSNLTRDLLFALQGLLASKNNLISSWVRYETARMALYRDLEVMQISPEGNWINDNENDFRDLSDRVDTGWADLGFECEPTSTDAGRANQPTHPTQSPTAASPPDGEGEQPPEPAIERLPALELLE